MGRFFQFMMTLDRRIIYLVVAAVLFVSLLVGKQETSPAIQPSVQQLYDAVDAVTADKLIIFDGTFAPNTRPENGNQLRALLRHAVLKKKRFAIMAMEPQGAELSKQIALDVTGQYGYAYGKDWISFGYQLGVLAFFKAVIQDVPGTMKADGITGKPLTPETFPVMKGIHTMKDVGLLVEVTSTQVVWYWVQITQPAVKPRLKIGYATTGIGAPEAYPFLDSEQLTGMMPGLKGAAEYEQLVDNLEKTQLDQHLIARAYDPELMKNTIVKPARVLMFTQNNAHIAVLLLVLLGNLAMLFLRPRRANATKEAAR
jgi:hypothetical protein